MNKCNLCVWSKPTGQIGAWECLATERYDYCICAVQRMMQYAELRANGNKDIFSELHADLNRMTEAISRLR